MTTTFKVGHTYGFTTYGDGDGYRSTYRVVSRTAKFVTLEGQRPDNGGPTKRCGVYVYEGVESCRPWGSYSMCPILTADREAPGETVTPQRAGLVVVL